MGSAVPFQTPAQEMRHIVAEAVSRGTGRGRATQAAARELGLTERRVRAILNGEVARIWADELAEAQAWYERHCARQAALREHEAALYRARHAALRARLQP